MGMGAPPPQDGMGMGGPPGGGGFGAPPAGDPFGAPPNNASAGFGAPPPGGGMDMNNPMGGAPGGFGAPQGQSPYGAPPPPQDYGAQAAQGFNQMGQAMNQGMGGAMQPFGGAPMMGMPGAGGPQKAWLTTLLLAVFGGYLGIHRFYTGHTLFGVIQLLTCGGFGFWQLFDIIMIAMGKYTDAQGRPLAK